MYLTKKGYLRCSKCKKIKSKRSFHKSCNKPTKYNTSCKVCRAFFAKTKYKKDHKKVKQKQRIYYNKMKKRAVEYLGGKCILCGSVFHSCCYDFHHKDPTQKETKLSAKLNCTFEIIKKELDKCELLCSNCHRLKHFKENIKIAEETDP